MPDEIQQQIESLRTELERHNRLYYVDAQPEISDLEYDQLLKQLEQLETEHPEFDSPDSPTHKVGGEPVEGFNSVEHRVPMISIDNVYEIENSDPKKPDVRKFDHRIRELLDVQPEYLIEYKIDGVALALIYEGWRMAARRRLPEPLEFSRSLNWQCRPRRESQRLGECCRQKAEAAHRRSFERCESRRRPFGHRLA